MAAHAVRWLCALLAGFVLVNVGAGLLLPGFDASIWVVDLRWLPVWAGGLLVVAASVPIVLGVWRPGPRLGRCAQLGAGLLCAVMLADAARFYVLLARDSIHSDFPVAAAALYAVVMGMGVMVFGRAPAEVARRYMLAGTAAAAAVAAMFPVLQMACFGMTDYRRPADAALVFGARTYADGRASDALSDRVVEACGLYHAGLVKNLILSGGPGDGIVDEAEAMRRLATSLGVPAERMIFDHAGVNTLASVRNAGAIRRRRGMTRVLAVSHFYHLPRIKLEAGREGLELYTVPATQRQPLKGLAWFVARETAAWWRHWARPVC